MMQIRRCLVSIALTICCLFSLKCSSYCDQWKHSAFENLQMLPLQEVRRVVRPDMSYRRLSQEFGTPYRLLEFGEPYPFVLFGDAYPVDRMVNYSGVSSRVSHGTAANVYYAESARDVTFHFYRNKLKFVFIDDRIRDANGNWIHSPFTNGLLRKYWKDPDGNPDTAAPGMSCGLRFFENNCEGIVADATELRLCPMLGSAAQQALKVDFRYQERLRSGYKAQVDLGSLDEL